MKSRTELKGQNFKRKQNMNGSSVFNFSKNDRKHYFSPHSVAQKKTQIASKSTLEIYSNDYETHNGSEHLSYKMMQLKLDSYKKIIENQAKQISDLKKRLGQASGRNIKYSKTPENKKLNPHYFKETPEYIEYWKLSEQAVINDNRSLRDLPGYKDLWICNIDKKLANNLIKLTGQSSSP